MEEFNDTPAGRRFYLETLLRQRKHWNPSRHGADVDLIARRFAKIDELKIELGVTDEAAFLREQEVARGGP